MRPAAAPGVSAAPGPPAPDALTAILAAGGALLSGRLAAAERRLVEIAGDAAAVLAGPARATITAGGKRLRPMLVFACAPPAEQADAAADDPALVRAAVAVELIHSATLVHDDVLDAAAVRRGRPTVVAACGRSAAVATGDLLFSRAFAELALNGAGGQLAVLSDASDALARGELVQRDDAFRGEVGVERYLLRCELKTARLFDAACRLGVLAGTGDGDGAAAPADVLGAFGRRIGLAFQLLDDVLDVTGPPELTGKPRGADLLDGTVNLPLILARRGDRSLRDLDLRALTDGPRLLEVCERIEATGALGEVRERALGMVATAKADLPASLDPTRRRLLELVAESVVRRYA